MTKIYTFLLIGISFFSLCNLAFAVEASEMLTDPILEERAQQLSKQLKCPVCQNNTIDDSNADLARDLRLIVRERLAAGDRDEEVLLFIQERYGDYVLLSPPLKTETLFLWFSPLILLVIGGSLLFLLRRPETPKTSLTAQEAQALREFEKEMAEK